MKATEILITDIKVKQLFQATKLQFQLKENPKAFQDFYLGSALIKSNLPSIHVTFPVL